MCNVVQGSQSTNQKSSSQRKLMLVSIWKLFYYYWAVFNTRFSKSFQQFWTPLAITAAVECCAIFARALLCCLCIAILYCMCNLILNCLHCKIRRSEHCKTWQCRVVFIFALYCRQCNTILHVWATVLCALQYSAVCCTRNRYYIKIFH